MYKRKTVQYHKAVRILTITWQKYLSLSKNNICINTFLFETFILNITGI